MSQSVITGYKCPLAPDSEAHQAYMFDTMDALPQISSTTFSTGSKVKLRRGALRRSGAQRLLRSCAERCAAAAAPPPLPCPSLRAPPSRRPPLPRRRGARRAAAA